MAVSRAREVVRSLRDMQKRQIAANDTSTKQAVIRKLNPLIAEVTDTGIDLDDDDIDFGATVRTYDKTFGLKVGDTLILVRTREGDWLAVDVLADDDQLEVVKPPIPPPKTETLPTYQVADVIPLRTLDMAVPPTLEELSYIVGTLLQDLNGKKFVQ